MISIRPIACIAVLLLSTGTGFADASLADMGSASACSLDRVREIIAGAEKAGADASEADRLMLENTADWLPDYEAFAMSPEAAELAAATATIGKRPSRAECRQLLPFAAVAASAARLSKAGAAVSPGSVLETCDDGLCVTAATSKLIEQCRVALFRLPLRATC